MNTNMNLYVISLIDVLLNAKFKPKEEYLLQDIKIHFVNIKREIARDQLMTGSSDYALERLDSFIRVLDKDIKTIKLLPLSERTIDIFEFTVKEVIELIEGNKVMIMLT